MRHGREYERQANLHCCNSTWVTILLHTLTDILYVYLWTHQITRRLRTFISKCLRRMNIKWADKITNEELWRITKEKPTEIQIKRRKWNWIGHTLRKEAGAIEKTALDWNPQGYRRRGRLKRMWRRTTEDEIRNTGRSWNEVKEIAGDRNPWKPFMGSKRNWWWWLLFQRFPGFARLSF